MTDQTVLKETPSPSGPPQGRAPEIKAALPHGGRPNPRSLIVGALIAVVVGVGLYFYVPGFWQVSTNDAYDVAYMMSFGN